MNLTVSNLLVCAIMNPLLIMDAASTSSSNSSILDSGSVLNICSISDGAMAIVTTSSIFSVLLIAVDQYFAVVDPLRYRARVGKLKSGILILSTWMVSIVFGFLAFFNPNPQSFWLSCIPKESNSLNLLAKSSLLTVLGNGTNNSEVMNVTSAISDIIETVSLDDNIDLIDNATVILDTLIDDTITYGFVYAIVYSIFAYFVPFVAVCWIYVSIYTAAHRNSERARRSGSRPVLSSASLTEEQNNGPSSRVQRLQIDVVDDVRKLPKISSLSSIDETSETMQPTTGQLSRRRSFSSSVDIDAISPSSSSPDDKQTSPGVVFMVGLQRLEVSQSMEDGEDRNDDLLHGNSCSSVNGDEEEKNRRDTENKETEQSARDLEEYRHVNKWISRNFIDECSDESNEEEVARFDCSEKKFSPLCNYSPNAFQESPRVAETLGQENDETKENGISDDRREEEVEVELKSHISSQGEFETQQASCSEVRFDRRLPSFFDKCVSSQPCENSNSKTEKTGSGGGVSESSSSCLLTPIVTITPAPSRNDNLHRVSSVRSTSSYINSLKDRISNGSIFRHREEARAARISALVIVMGLICWSPYVILLVMKNLPRSTDQHLPHNYDVLASSLMILAAYISPLLFGYRSKRVKRELRRFFCFRRELSYKNNRSLMAKKVLKRRHSSNLSHFEMDHKYNIFSCVYGKSRWPKEKVQFVQVPDTALAVETCRSSFSSGASTQISSTSTEEC